MPSPADDQQATPWFSGVGHPQPPAAQSSSSAAAYSPGWAELQAAGQVDGRAPDTGSLPLPPGTEMFSPGTDVFPPGAEVFPQVDGGTQSSGVHDLDDDLYDREWDKPRRANRWTAVLVAGILGCGAFIGGVLVQKNHDEGLTSGAAGVVAALRNRTGSGTAAGGYGAAGGFGAAGGYGAAGGFGGGGTAGARAGTGAGTGSGGGIGQGGSGTGTGQGGDTAGAAAGVPVAVGTLQTISGTTLTLKNFADAVITVHVPATATVTTPGLTGLRPGMSVSVSGTKAADGTVTATSVVGRTLGG
jgi:hypothetical protein